MEIHALIFDVFGTLVDWRGSVARAVSEHFGDEVDANQLALEWRAEYDPAMAPIRDGQRPYTNLDLLHRENLDRVLARHGLANRLDEAQKTHLARAWERLAPWPDAVPGLMQARQTYLVAPCSNGSIALMSHLARHARFHWDCILGAEIARTYKPEPETYLAACRALQLPPDQVMMVAAHNSDLIAARAAGLRTGFFPRPTEYPPERKRDHIATGPWDVIATDLPDLVNQLQAAPRIEE